MVCIAVTRGGWGEVWSFSTVQEAARHPLIQYGDAIVSSPEDTLESWNYLFLARMCAEVLGDRDLEASVRERIDSAPDDRVRASRAAVASEDVWSALKRAAGKPPHDPSDIVRRIAEDRKKHDEWHERETNRRTSVTQAQGATAGTTAAAAAPKEAKEKKIAGHAPSAKISFGADKDGKAYNTTDNNPKRAGTKSGDRFAKYKAGQTLEAAVAAGVSAADIKWDESHGYIKIS